MSMLYDLKALEDRWFLIAFLLLLFFFMLFSFYLFYSFEGCVLWKIIIIILIQT